MRGTAVLVVEVVGVFPDVKGEDGFKALGDGVGGAGLLGDGERAVRRCREPYPAGAEEPGALGDEVVLEGVEGAPLLQDLREEMPGRAGHDRFLRFARNDRGSAIPGNGLELREVQIVVQYLAGVVENGPVGLAYDILQRHALELRPGNQPVQVVDIALQMLAVVETDRPGADYWLQRILRIRKFNQ